MEETIHFIHISYIYSARYFYFHCEPDEINTICMLAAANEWLLFSNSLWLIDTICWHRSGSTFPQVIADCLIAPSHYLSQCGLIIKVFSDIPLKAISQEVPLKFICNRADSRLAPSQWGMSLQSNAISHWLGTNLESALCKHVFRYYVFEIANKSPRSQWVDIIP